VGKSNMDLIKAQHISKSFGSTMAVKDLTLRVAAGEVYGLVGPDGAGKTTTLRLLCGALRPDSKKEFHTKEIPRSASPVYGETYKPTIAADVTDESSATILEVGGFDLSTQADQAREMIGYLPQRFSLYEDLTVLENLRFFAEVRGIPSSEWQPRCLEILRFVGLDGFLDRRAAHLSGGMKQKLGLAAAMAHRPRLLLLDEPTTGVDPVTRQDFWQLIIQLVSSVSNGQPEVAVLVSTPYMDEAVRCTRLGFMREGRLLLEGTPSELRSRLAGQILELRGQPLTLLRLTAEAIEGIQDVRMFGDRMHIRVSAGQTENVMIRLYKLIPDAGGEIHQLRPIPAQLEDVFVSLLQ
jgi:ABC-2 type transport system ATP-binding protein